MIIRQLTHPRFLHQLVLVSKSHPLLQRPSYLPPVKAMSHSGLDGIDLAGMRKPYKTGHEAFLESDMVSTDPFKQFSEWFKIASQTDGTGEVNAMVLSTASKDGVPSARWVLLKGFDEQGFKFYTNYGSRKAKDLEENPKACLVFYWEVLSRSIRIEGTVEKLSEEESTAYFHSRPKGSQIGACVSHQSTPIPNRQALIDKEEELKEKYKDPDAVIPKPDYWGGFRVKPEVFEFWQGQSTRLHDRIVFRRPCDREKADGYLLHEGENGWVYERLAP
ncbi:Pyridoxine-5'-phosphate oxidase [Holothuria leucospilota]|uniref:pyridoxal 5'-phosphate synthase n=1 Tax=Holothuria leucospilota TaxID=206669 RepID=A0A9Q1BE56_HOLLE|nr:Pyridoxine-5'-phosphate oxidase [Holothuria leucospilota]